MSVCAGVYAPDKTALADGRERATQLRARQERGAGARSRSAERAGSLAARPVTGGLYQGCMRLMCMRLIRVRSRVLALYEVVLGSYSVYQEVVDI